MSDSTPRIQTLEQAERTVQSLRAKGKRIVFTNGCFDLLHTGHTRYLQMARELGDFLVIGLNSDQSIRELKGPGRPILPEDERAELLASLRCVDLVVLFSEKRVTRLLQALRPEIYVKGGDYTRETLDPEERKAIEAYGGEIILLPKFPARSTTSIIERILEKGG